MSGSNVAVFFLPSSTLAHNTLAERRTAFSIPDWCWIATRASLYACVSVGALVASAM